MIVSVFHVVAPIFGDPRLDGSQVARFAYAGRGGAHLPAAAPSDLREFSRA